MSHTQLLVFVYVNTPIAEQGLEKNHKSAAAHAEINGCFLVKTSLGISEHSETLFAFLETACSRTQQVWLSTCPHTHLSLDDIERSLLILLKPILPNPKAPNTVLSAFRMINGKLEKNMGEAHWSPVKRVDILCSTEAKTDF